MQQQWPESAVCVGEWNIASYINESKDKLPQEVA